MGEAGDKAETKTEGDLQSEKSGLDLETSLDNAMSEVGVNEPGNLSNSTAADNMTIGERMVGLSMKMFNENGRFKEQNHMGEHVVELAG
jgi:hypothetical protein